MVVGILTIRLLVRESRSLKDKRQVVRGVLDKLRANFNVSAAEVDTLDDHRVFTLGVAAVGPDVAGVKSCLDAIQNALRSHPVAEYLGGEASVGREVV